MAAAAFKATLVFQGARSGRFSRFCTVSDVNAAYYVFQDGNSFISFGEEVQLVDLILSAAGTDTTTAAVYKDGAPTSLQIINSANVYTVLNRQIQSVQPKIPAGSTIKFVQAT
jgi:hypothetical protein